MLQGVRGILEYAQSRVATLPSVRVCECDQRPPVVLGLSCAVARPATLSCPCPYEQWEGASHTTLVLLLWSDQVHSRSA